MVATAKLPAFSGWQNVSHAEYGDAILPNIGCGLTINQCLISDHGFHTIMQMVATAIIYKLVFLPQQFLIMVATP
jgi:hypothetical protein